MNLWVKRTGQLLLAALFLMACEDETSLLGFRNPISKFEVKFIELPVESSVLLIDSIRTSNFGGETSRILVGEHNDPELGTTKTTAFTQLFPTSNVTVDAAAALDSVVLHLRFDYYLYGGTNVSNQSFNIHSLTEDLYSDSVLYYFSDREVAYDPAPIGNSFYLVNPELFKTQDALANNQKDTTVLKVRLSNSFGQRLMDRAKAGDSTYTRFSEFVKYIKGIAIVPEVNDKVVGFDLNNTLDAGSLLSKIVVHYHTDTEDSLQLNFGFGGAQFTNIETDRSATEISELTTFYDPVTPANDLRYIQNGTGVITKLDLTSLLEFSETNPKMIINSADLFIEGLQHVENYSPINSFNMLVLTEENRFRKIKLVPDTIINTITNDTTYSTKISSEDISRLALYQGLITNSGGYYSAVSDLNSPYTLNRSSSNNSYTGNFTLLAQQLYELEKENKEPFRYFALFPNTPQNGKSLNRIMFNKDAIKLRIYYTLPTVNE